VRDGRLECTGEARRGEGRMWSWLRLDLKRSEEVSERRGDRLVGPMHDWHTKKESQSTKLERGRGAEGSGDVGRRQERRRNVIGKARKDKI
jgi:hypothetical protein